MQLSSVFRQFRRVVSPAAVAVITVASITALAPDSATAADYYVATNGNDANSCSLAQNINTPRRTIRQGISCLVAGDTLMIRGGTYSEYIDYAGASGTSWTNPVTIARYPGETVTMVGAFNIGNSPVKQYIIFDGLVIDGARSQAQTVRIADGANHIRFINGELRNATTFGVLIPHQTATDNQFVNMKIHGHGEREGLDHGLYISGDRTIVENSQIFNNKAWGVHIYNGYTAETSNGNVVRNNRIYNNGTTGTNGGGVISGSGTGTVIYNNLIYSNKDGIVICCGSIVEDQRIYNNTIYGNSRYGIEVQAGSGTIVVNNILRSNVTANTRFLVSVSASNNFTADPLFVNAAAGDFQLQQGSAAIDTGLTVGLVATDHSGVPRPQGLGYDLGALEYRTTSDPAPTSGPAPPTNLRIDAP